MIAFWLRKENESLRSSSDVGNKTLLDAQNARITNLEESQKACEIRYNLLLQHVLTLKNAL